MRGLFARTLALAVAVAAMGVPAGASDDRVEIELTGRIEPSCKLARGGSVDPSLSNSERPQVGCWRQFAFTARGPVSG